MEITLPTGQHAQIDDQDAELVQRHKWHALHHPCGRTYAMTTLPDGPRHPDGRRNRRQVFMHNLILATPPGQRPDHVNNDGLDNRRENLRPATGTQNNANSRKRTSPTTSPYKGVSRKRHNISKPWLACIRSNGHQHHLGYYPTPELAAKAYDEAARELFGEYARPNFTEEA